MTSAKKRIAYALRSKYHFHYFSSTIRQLCAEGHSLTIAFDEQWSEGKDDQAAENARKEFPGMAYEVLIRRKGILRPFLFQLREILNYARYFRTEGQSVYYRDRWVGYMPIPMRLLVRFPLVQMLLSKAWFRNALARLERSAPPDPRITAWLKALAPDVLVVSPGNMRYSEEIEYVRAAGPLGIPTVVQIISWDNLTTKGLFHGSPDHYLVWNKTQKEEAILFHGADPGSVVITGAPVFDQWFRAMKSTLDRGDFLRKVGLPPDRPFIVYLGSSKNIAKDESWIVLQLAREFDEIAKSGGQPISILVRPHPANASIYSAIRDPGISVWPREGKLPDTEDGFMDFYSSMGYCVCSVGINTTGMIDAVIADKPVISILAKEYVKTQVLALHFKHLVEADVLEFAENPALAARQCHEILKGSDHHAEQRRRFVSDFIRPRGAQGFSCEFAAKAILMAAEGRKPDEIDKALPHVL